MAGPGDGSESAAERLEAALERIAQLAVSPAPDGETAAADTREIAARLDGMIERLRAALNGES